MPKCIYTGADETTASFSDREHIFPKCIGGVRCLPLGYVSDEVNQAFSKLELGFAREHPVVATRRMFSPAMGRKKHTNRERVGVMQDTDHGTGFSLGMVRNGTPISLNQLIVNAELPEDIPQGFPIHIILSPSASLSHEQLALQFWERLAAYNGSPTCIKDDALPPYTYLLGAQDNRWFLALPKSENPELIKPRLAKLVAGVAKMKPEQFFSADETKIHNVRHHVEAHFSFSFNLIDYYRVCAKIAINCLAELKGVECAMDPALDGIKKAILTGEGMDNYARLVEGENPALTSLKQFSAQFPLGHEAHCVTFFHDEQEVLLAAVSFFGINSAVLIRLGNLARYVGTDCYICDWENHADYTMTEAVLKICGHDEEDWREPPAQTD